MDKTYRIKLKDGEKEAELEMNYQPEHELIIMDGVFKFFGIDVQYEEIAAEQLKIHQMYKEYYADDRNFRNAEGSAEFCECNETENFKETQNQILIAKDNPGIKRKNGTLLYRCNYKCPNCRNSGNHYIQESERAIHCHSCKYEMEVQKANVDFSHDENYNYFLAGLNIKKEN